MINGVSKYPSQGRILKLAVINAQLWFHDTAYSFNEPPLLSVNYYNTLWIRATAHSSENLHCLAQVYLWIFISLLAYQNLLQLTHCLTLIRAFVWHGKQLLYIGKAVKAQCMSFRKAKKIGNLNIQTGIFEQAQLNYLTWVLHKPNFNSK